MEDIMTQVKQTAVDLLKNISDEKAVYVIKFIQAIEDDSRTDVETVLAKKSGNSEVFDGFSQEKNLDERQAAYQRLLRYKGTLHRHIDYKKELAEYRDEKYGNSR